MRFAIRLLVLSAGLLLFTLAAPACDAGGSGPVPPGVNPEEIPPGDAKGSALTGTYAARVDVESVHCEKGLMIMTDGRGEARAFQRDGSLGVTLDLYDTPQLEGGVDITGSFMVGAVKRYDDGKYSKTYFMRGRIDESILDGTFSITAHGPDLHCDGLATITGTRR